MRYVVGCMGQYGELGRTFLCTDHKEIESAVLILVSANKEPACNVQDIVDDLTLRDCTTSEGVAGTYFVGGIENL